MDFDVALLDVNLPDGRGTDLLREKIFPHHKRIVMTAEAGGGAVGLRARGRLSGEAVRSGGMPVRFAQARRSLQTRRAMNSAAAGGRTLFGRASPRARTVAEDHDGGPRLGRHLPPVLIEGETGNRQTAIARWIHNHAPGEGPLVELNCSALPSAGGAELLDTTGCFTDAKRRASAHGGG